MMTSKERAALRAQANPLEVTLIVGKSGISQTLLDEAVILLDSHELVKGRVLETAGLTAREASDALCEALGAEGIACVGTKFVIWRKSEKLAQEKKKAAARKPAKKKPSGNDNPVKAGLRARKLHPRDYRDFDWLLCADRDNLADVRSRAPADATARSALLLDWAGQGTDAEVPDPYTGGSREFDQVWAMVEAAARAIVARFADRGRIDA